MLQEFSKLVKDSTSVEEALRTFFMFSLSLTMRGLRVECLFQQSDASDMGCPNADDVDLQRRPVLVPLTYQWI